ncbi:pullulanase, extracellular, partial [Granulicatella balaenopterae]
VWDLTISAADLGIDNLTGYYYHYLIERNGEKILALDPYAKSLAEWNSDADFQQVDGSTGKPIAKAAFINPSTVGPALDYAHIPGFNKREDAIIYEAHVRDFTSDANIAADLQAPFGTFKAFGERLDYLKDLGVTHIQLLPVMSYYFADESTKEERIEEYRSQNTPYNWGYDPQSYFSLTGMYTTNPKDAAARIEEFKELIQLIHEKDMGVILDVVYNHTAQTHIFEDLEPNYYHFMNQDGSPRESFGGGRLGTTHKMSRRILVDSINYWTKEFKVDGFRFDMMGDHDAESIQKAYDIATKANPNLLMLGEGWRTYTGDENKPVTAADQDWMTSTDSVGVFSDEMRNELKSGFGSEGQPRFLTGGARDLQVIYNNIIARPGNFTADDPGDVIQYIAAHDNLTLHDVIAQSIKKDPKNAEAEIQARIRLGNSMILTAQGTPFIHSGQEYGRTKQFLAPGYEKPVADAPYKSTYLTKADGTPFDYPYFIHDSYDSSDIINRFDWQKVTDKTNYPDAVKTHDYTRGLIQIRRSTDAFSYGTQAEVAQNVRMITTPRQGDLVDGVRSDIQTWDQIIGYLATASNGDSYAVFVNADSAPRFVSFNEQEKALLKGDVIADAQTAGLTAIENPTGVTLT